MIRVKCPKCAKIVGLDETKAGSVGKCPACQAQFKIPAPKAAAGAAKGKPGANIVKPGTEADDFVPYTVVKDEDDGSNRLLEDAMRADDMAKDAFRMKRREKAWEAIGTPAKMVKWLGLYGIGVTVIVYLIFIILLILTAHQLTKEPDPMDKAKGNINRGILTELTGIRFDARIGWIALGISTGVMVVSVVFWGIILAGAEKMKKLESYGWSMTSAIMSTIVGLGKGSTVLFFFYKCISDDNMGGMIGAIPGIPTIIAFMGGIWALMTLCQRNVKLEFPSYAEEREEQEEREWETLQRRLRGEDEEDLDDDEEDEEDEEDDEEEDEEDRRRQRGRK